MAIRKNWAAWAAAMALVGAAQAGPISGQGTWKTTLQGRDLDGNAANGPEAFYDTALDITWLDANVNGRMTWDMANTWANSLVVGGISGWRLPATLDTGAPGCNPRYAGTDCGYNVDTATSEMAHLFYVTLGNKAVFDSSGAPQLGYGLVNTGDFQNLQSDYYWSGLEYGPTNPSYAWYFGTSIGDQGPNDKSYAFPAVAVRPGDVARNVPTAVPEPQTYGLVLAGLAALVVAVRRQPR